MKPSFAATDHSRAGCHWQLVCQCRVPCPSAHAQPIGPTRLQVQRRSTATRYRVYAPTGFRRHRGQLGRAAPPDPAPLDRSLLRMLQCLYQDLSKPQQAALRGQMSQVPPPSHRQRRTRRCQQPNLPRQAFVKRFRTVKTEKKTGPPRTRTRLSLNQPIAGSGTFKPGVLANRSTRWIFPSFVTSPFCDRRGPLGRKGIEQHLCQRFRKTP